MNARRTRLVGLVVALGALASAGCAAARHAAADPQAGSQIGSGGPFSVVDLHPSDGRLTTQLASAASDAAAAKLRPYVELTSAWCQACHWLDRSLSKQSVAQAFGGTYVVRVDVDRFEGRLSGTGLDYHVGPLPAFVALDHTGRPIGDWVDRKTWSSDVPTQAAPVLAEFFHWWE
jgi:hypothetical protein